VLHVIQSIVTSQALVHFVFSELPAFRKGHRAIIHPPRNASTYQTLLGTQVQGPCLFHKVRLPTVALLITKKALLEVRARERRRAVTHRSLQQVRSSQSGGADRKPPLEANHSSRRVGKGQPARQEAEQSVLTLQIGMMPGDGSPVSLRTPICCRRRSPASMRPHAANKTRHGPPWMHRQEWTC
jgi:hypothetical protein